MSYQKACYLNETNTNYDFPELFGGGIEFAMSGNPLLKRLFNFTVCF